MAKYSTPIFDVILFTKLQETLKQQLNCEKKMICRTRTLVWFWVELCVRYIWKFWMEIKTLLPGAENDIANTAIKMATPANVDKTWRSNKSHNFGH